MIKGPENTQALQRPHIRCVPTLWNNPYVRYPCHRMGNAAGEVLIHCKLKMFIDQTSNQKDNWQIK